MQLQQKLFEISCQVYQSRRGVNNCHNYHIYYDDNFDILLANFVAYLQSNRGNIIFYLNNHFNLVRFILQQSSAWLVADNGNSKVFTYPGSAYVPFAFDSICCMDTMESTLRYATYLFIYLKNNWPLRLKFKRANARIRVQSMPKQELISASQPFA